MMRLLALLAILIAAVPLPAAAAAASAPGGYVTVGRHAVAFIPARPDPSVRLPVMILFHGAGSTAQAMIRTVEPVAAEFGVALLAVQSRGATWDLIAVHFDPSQAQASRLDPNMHLPSGDRKSVESALAALFTRFPVDGARVGLLGFSDGASYALSLAAFDPDRFAFAAGLSPAFALIPQVRSDAARRQRIYIAHGREDRVLSFIQSRDAICPDFLRSGRTVRFRAFDGGHRIARDALEEAFRDFLEARPPAADDPSFRCGRGPSLQADAPLPR